MKKKYLIVAIIIIALLVLFIPKVNYLNDGGTIEYKAVLYSVTKYHKIKEDSAGEYLTGISVKILGFELYNNFDNKEIQKNEGKTNEQNQLDESKDRLYIRTYTIENIKQGQEENSYYITLSAFQNETDTVFIPSLLQELEVGKTYEFEFSKKDNSTNIEDSIESIFENCNIVSITETTKKGLDQQQDSIN